jgi:hypothetical protein
VLSAGTETKKKSSKEGRESETSQNGPPDLKALLAGKSQLKRVEIQEKHQGIYHISLLQLICMIFIFSTNLIMVKLLYFIM